MDRPRVRKVMTPPINVIFKFLQHKTRVQIMLFEQKDMRLEGQIVGFDEHMNMVLDDADELSIKKDTRKKLGRVMLKGENVALLMPMKAAV